MLNDRPVIYCRITTLKSGSSGELCAVHVARSTFFIAFTNLNNGLNFQLITSLQLSLTSQAVHGNFWPILGMFICTIFTGRIW